MYAAVFPDGFLRATTLEQERQAWLGVYRPLLAEVGVSDPHDILAQKLVDECNYTRWLVAYPEVHHVLGQLRGRFQLGVISNAPPSLPEGLEYLELATYFDTIVVSSLVGVQKPAAAIFQIALDAGGERVMANTVAIGAACGIAGYDFKYIAGVIEENFRRKGPDVVALNRKVAEGGYRDCSGAARSDPQHKHRQESDIRQSPA